MIHRFLTFTATILIGFIAMAEMTMTNAQAKAQTKDMHFDKPWVRHTNGRTSSAAIYMTIRNDTDHNDMLMNVSSPAADMTMIHGSSENEGIMQMHHMDTISIRKGHSFSMVPGAYHIMLMRLTKPLQKGSSIPLKLTFEKSGTYIIEVPVTDMMGLH